MTFCFYSGTIGNLEEKRVNFGVVGKYWNSPSALAGISFKVK